MSGRAFNKKLSTEKVKETVEQLGSTATEKDAAAVLGVEARSLDTNQKIIRNEDGDIDLDATYQKFATLEEARRAREEIDSNIQRVKLRRLRGELVDVKLVEASVLDAMKGLLDALQSNNRTLAPQLAAISDPKQILRLMDEANSKAINALRSTWRVPEAA